MRTTPFLLLSFLLPSFLLPALAAQDPAATAAAPTARARLTFADTAPGRVSFVGRVPMVRWVDGGAFVEILAGKAVQQIDPATGESRRAAAADAAGAAGAASKRKVVRIHDGDLWLDEDAGGPTPRRRRGPGSRRPSEKAVRLTTDGSANGRKAEAHLSPDQSHVAFTRGNDLVVLDVPDLSGV